jgi:hypothetical protein
MANQKKNVPTKQMQQQQLAPPIQMEEDDMDVSEDEEGM